MGASRAMIPNRENISRKVELLDERECQVDSLCHPAPAYVGYYEVGVI